MVKYIISRNQTKVKYLFEYQKNHSHSFRIYVTFATRATSSNTVINQTRTSYHSLCLPQQLYTYAVLTISFWHQKILTKPVISSSDIYRITFVAYFTNQKFLNSIHSC